MAHTAPPWDAKGGRHADERLRPRTIGERTAGPRPRGGGASRPRQVADPPPVTARPPRRRPRRARTAPARRAGAAAGGVVIRPAREADNAHTAAIRNLKAIGTPATTVTNPPSTSALRTCQADPTDNYPDQV